MGVVRWEVGRYKGNEGYRVSCGVRLKKYNTHAHVHVCFHNPILHFSCYTLTTTSSVPPPTTCLFTHKKKKKKKRYLFWSVSGPTPRIQRSLMDGSNQVYLVGPGGLNVVNPGYVASDSTMGQVYWVDETIGPPEVNDFYYVNGSVGQPSVPTKLGFSLLSSSDLILNQVLDMTVFGQWLYWSDASTGNLQRVSKTFSRNMLPQKQTIVDVHGSGGVCGLAAVSTTLPIGGCLLLLLLLLACMYVCVLIGLFVPHPQSKRGATPTMATVPSCVFPRARWLDQPVPAPCTSPVATASVWVRVGVGVAACGRVGVAACGHVGVATHCGHVGVATHGKRCRGCNVASWEGLNAEMI